MDSILPYIFDLKNEIDVLLSKYKDQKEKNVNLSSEKEKLLASVHDLENQIKELKERVEVVDLCSEVGRAHSLTIYSRKSWPFWPSR